VTPLNLPVALGVCRLAARLPAAEQVPAAGRVLAVLGLVPYAGWLDPLPTACGHPSARLRRDWATRGTVCLDCRNGWKAGTMTREPAEGWRTRAACLIEDPELFFPISTHPDRQTTEAKAVCRTCPVRDTCRAWALETQQGHGILGGLTEAERRTILRRAERDATKARKTASVAAVEERGQMRRHSQERRDVVATLTTRGLSAAEIGLRLSVTPRQVRRDRDQIRGAR